MLFVLDRCFIVLKLELVIFFLQLAEYCFPLINYMEISEESLRSKKRLSSYSQSPSEIPHEEQHNYIQVLTWI
jgi:hypothetical protein